MRTSPPIWDSESPAPNGYNVFVPYADFIGGSYTLEQLEAGSYSVTEENAQVVKYTLMTEGEGDVEMVVSITNIYSREIVIPYVPVEPEPPVYPEPPVDPLADVPQTDDKMALYQVLVLLYGMGLWPG